MKVAFIHDGPFYKDENSLIYSLSYPKEILNVYCENNLRIISRVSEGISSNLKLNSTHLDIKGISLIKLQNYSDKVFFFRNKMNNNRIIKREVKKSDYVIIRLPSNSGNKAARVAQKYNIPYLIEFVGDPLLSYWYHSWLGKLIAPFSYFITRGIVQNATNVIYVTKKSLSRRYPTNGNAGYISDVVIRKSKNHVLEDRINKIKSSNNKIIIGLIGNLNVKYKGHKKVIDALVKLNREGRNNYHFQIVGDGDNTELLTYSQKKEISHKVEFMGSLSHDKVLEWMDNIDIYIQPSDLEGLPRGVLEAMSRGLPIIASNVGGIPELIPSSCLVKGRNQSTQIAELLKKFDTNKMVSLAEINFENAKKYEFEKLLRQRTNFVKDFISREVTNDV